MTAFHDHNKVALPREVLEKTWADNKAQGLTDDGSRPIAERLEKPIPYYDPNFPIGHGPAIVATNTLQQAHAVASGFLTDVEEVQRIRAAAQAAKDAAPEG